jgi:ribulose-phosphate 3-epimerase
MMVMEPEKLVESFAKAGADFITLHIEATEDPDGLIDLIKSCGCKVGISLKPKTALEEIYPFLDKIDLVLIMTVEPGFGGQGYLPGSSERISKLKAYLNTNCLERVLIEVDGGIKLHNAKEIIEAGADVLVAGSAVFGTENPVETIKAFYQIKEK